ncbi:uncharacterized protein BKCO1_5800013 [Diplodia corticola]|uniref:DUF7580 domain-containing protein n=1 Tax=Diplodia corticola TaxID=236234 RepID=A0A1J9RDL7_9PEZI|nr:uncharacterized protein BKCO1_5800013 [Diplodia corticola]OJD30643.1 hypothetical protein BKCO1_5800013 [Diplodia corticola]
MFGFEFAGLILAIVPIVIAAADHQRRVYGAFTTALRSRVKDEKLASQYQHLHNEVALLNLTIRDFIVDLPALSTSDKEQLLKLDQQLWKEDRVKLALSQKLGNSDAAFVDALKTVLKCLDDVLSDRVLKLQRADIVQAPRGLYTKLEALREYGGDPKDLKGRIRFTSSDSKRRRALSLLTEQNKTLERFIRHQPVAGEARGTQPIQESEWRLPPRLRARNLIHSMYDAIARVWTSHCTCPSPHEAMLSLCGCFAWFEEASDDGLDLFISTGHEAHRKWQQSRVRVEPAQRRDSMQVRFEGSTTPPGSRRTSPSTSEGKVHVESICGIVCTARQNNVALEVVYESDTLWHKARKQSTRIMEPCVTLDQLLRDETSRKLKERRVLAVLLAHSLLHLSNDSWLKDEWDKTHISFFSSAPDQLNLKPYLTTDFQALAESNDGSGMQLHPSPAILALGIVLLELQIWATIESRRLPEDLTDDGSVNVNTNLMTAERVFRDADDEIFENYRAAVRACLDCDFLDEHGVDVDFNDDGFRTLVYENIVAPLERELYQGWKMKPKDLLTPKMERSEPQTNPRPAATGKRQPWKAVWPAPREPQSQANLFGFKKGEMMVFDGNAGNFFARDKWTIEQESSQQ